MKQGQGKGTNSVGGPTQNDAIGQLPVLPGPVQAMKTRGDGTPALVLRSQCSAYNQYALNFTL